MTQAIPYLVFPGTCAEAMRFYELALGGTVQLVLTGADTPMKDHMPPEMLNRVMHARLALPGGGMLYGGDCPPSMPHEGMKGVSIAIDYDSVERATEVYNALAEGGQAMMPLQPAFWAGIWGMVVDRYGVMWNVNGAPVHIG